MNRHHQPMIFKAGVASITCCILLAAQDNSAALRALKTSADERVAL